MIVKSFIGGDFNVDFSMIRVQTSPLRSFCDGLCLQTAAKHHDLLADYIDRILLRFGSAFWTIFWYRLHCLIV
jgi:hypothetical protein